MTLARKITIDRSNRYSEGAYVVVREAPGQAPIVWEVEGCDTGYEAALARVDKLVSDKRIGRWCICRLVPVEGNELLVLDLERLQKLHEVNE